MKHICWILLLLSIEAFTQVAKDYAVLLTATVSASPANITLHWPADPNALSYTIWKKAVDETLWGTSIASLDGDAVMFSDDDVVVDSAYEYRVARTSMTDLIVTEANGYICSGINLHLPDYRGKCLLIVDTTVTSGMENELYRLMKDISGDGWSVERINVSRNDSPVELRELIISKYNLDNHISAVLLFGHVPVLYSGNIFPDGHFDHQGAWPADAIYGDMAGVYTDEFVDITAATRPENWNVPGDGKYDQSVLQSKLKLQVGRIDLYNLPSFPESEEQLLKNYLDKDHAYRTGILKAGNRALIDDNFGAFGGEAFAANGWRNFTPLLGSDEIFEADYFSSLNDSASLWSYGCGGGWYQGASGVGSTTDFAADTAKTVFTLLFGSYFGDWDVTDNFLRAPLANKYTLTNAWAGRPHWHFQHMAMGETIGFSTRLTQNNQNTYFVNYFPKGVHIALMGDPTLRMHVVQPPSNISFTVVPEGSLSVGIEFTASPDPDVLGYFIYRSQSEFGIYERITPEIITETYFVAYDNPEGWNHFMVKAVRLEETPSGTYFNLSTGISDSVELFLPVQNIYSQNSIEIYPNPATDQFRILKTSSEYELISIYSAEGQLMDVFQLTGIETTIDVTSYPPGIYFLRSQNSCHPLILE